MGWARKLSFFQRRLLKGASVFLIALSALSLASCRKRSGSTTAIQSKGALPSGSPIQSLSERRQENEEPPPSDEHTPSGLNAQKSGKAANEAPSSASALRQLSTRYRPESSLQNSLEQLITDQWLHRPDALLSALKDSENAHFNEAVFDILFSNISSPAAAGDWLDWLQSFGQIDGEHRNLQSQALFSLASKIEDMESSEEIFSTLSNLLLPHLAEEHSAPFRSRFGALFAQRYPDRVPELIRSLPAGAVSDSAREQAVYTAAQTKPESVAEWLSSPEIFSELFYSETRFSEEMNLTIDSEEPLSQEHALQEKNYLIQVGYDRALHSYVRGILNDYPQDALETAELIQDPALREKTLNTVRTRMEWLNNQQNHSSAN